MEIDRFWIYLHKQITPLIFYFHPKLNYSIESRDGSTHSGILDRGTRTEKEPKDKKNEQTEDNKRDHRGRARR